MLFRSAGVLESRDTWTANKLLKGAGAGIDPTEIDVPTLDYPMKLKPNITRYVIPGWYTYGSTTSVPGVGVICYEPIFVMETTTYDRIGIEVTAAVAGTADLRIFNCVNGLPTSLVLSAGTVDTGTTGSKEIIISQELSRGYYFLAIRCSANPTLRAPSNASPPVAGISTTATPMATNRILTVTAAFADPAPTPTNVGMYNYTFLREA